MQEEVGRGLMEGIWGWEQRAPAAAAFGELPWLRNVVFHFGEQKVETQPGGSTLDSPGAAQQPPAVELGPPGCSERK